MALLPTPLLPRTIVFAPCSTLLKASDSTKYRSKPLWISRSAAGAPRSIFVRSRGSTVSGVIRFLRVLGLPNLALWNQGRAAAGGAPVAYVAPRLGGRIRFRHGG